MRIAGGQEPPAGAVEVGRNIERAHKIHGFLVPARRPHLAAEQYRGSFRVDEQIGELLYVGRIAQ